MYIILNFNLIYFIANVYIEQFPKKKNQDQFKLDKSNLDNENVGLIARHNEKLSDTYSLSSYSFLCDTN